MSKVNKPVRPTRPPAQDRGYQPVSATKGCRPRPQGGHQSTDRPEAPGKPPFHPPNQGTSAKKRVMSVVARNENADVRLINRAARVIDLLDRLEICVRNFRDSRHTFHAVRTWSANESFP